jgi:PAS domain S-box-containing protein
MLPMSPGRMKIRRPAERMMSQSTPVRILYMEDMAALARLFQKNLSRSGYVVDVAPDGNQGLAMYEAGSYDVLVLDHQMPGKNGLEVLEYLSSRGELPPTIMLTGAGNEDIAVDAMKLGASDYILKDTRNRYLELMPSVIDRALENDLLRRQKLQAEEELRRAHDQLELRVRQRTRELVEALEKLQREVAVRTEAETRIRRQNEFLDNVLESLTHPFYVIDANDYSIQMSNSAAGLLSSEGKSTCYALTHQTDEPCSSAEHPCPLKEVKAEKKPVVAKHVHPDEEGHQRAVEIHAYPIFNSDGEVTQVIEYALDVTARKEAEQALMKSQQRFKAIFESAGDCIFIKDTEGRYSLVNPAMSALLDLPISSMLGRNEEELFGKDAGDHMREIESRVLKGELVEEEYTTLIQGFPITFLRTIVPLHNSEGVVDGICGIARNITDRKDSPAVARSTESEYSSKAMRSTWTAAHRAAQHDSVVLLTGESGSGKDYLAKHIHDQSKRSGGPFFAINCAAVTPELAESELFGHEAGAFTGAARRKRGLLELAEGGSLLLNEIGELSLPLQAKLLTFLDTRQFTRVGGERNITVSARLIVATNRDLEKDVTEGSFRRDLFYRLNVFSIQVPPLRDRIEDLPVLVEEITSQLAADMQLDAIPTIDPAAANALAAYHWPGNVRELRNVLERALILSDGTGIHVNRLGLTSSGQEWSHNVTFPEQRTLHDVTGDIKRSLVLEALRRSGGNKRAAARLLGISHDSIYRLLKDHGADVG